MLRGDIIQIKYLRFILLISSLFFFPSCVTTAEKLHPAPGEPVANFPEMHVGDSWIHKQKSHTHAKDFILLEKIISVEEDMSFVMEVQRSDNNKIFHQFFNHEYQIIKVTDFSKGTSFQISKPKKLLNFPLFVGKKWKDTYTSESVGGKIYDYINNYQVIKHETVSTGAGLFKSFKIRQLNDVLEGDLGGPWTIYHWYSPEVKRTIMTRYPDGALYGIRSDLQQFSLAKSEQIEENKKEPDSTTSQKLEKLKELLEKELITQEDYDKKKMELLNSL